MHADSKTHVVAKDGIRRLTPLECERAMGFPDNWTECGDDKERWKQLGNAVVPAIAEWIGRRIVTADPIERDRHEHVA